MLPLIVVVEISLQLHRSFVCKLLDIAIAKQLSKYCLAEHFSSAVPLLVCHVLGTVFVYA
jgi:hypothetical protein